VCDDIESSSIVVYRRRTIATSQCIVVDSIQEDKSVHMSRHSALAEPGDSIEVTFISSNVANSMLKSKANLTRDVNNRIVASKIDYLWHQQSNV
jgi:hypothetical protein